MAEWRVLPYASLASCERGPRPGVLPCGNSEACWLHRGQPECDCYSPTRHRASVLRPRATPIAALSRGAGVHRQPLAWPSFSPLPSLDPVPGRVLRPRRYRLRETRRRARFACRCHPSHDRDLPSAGAREQSLPPIASAARCSASPAAACSAAHGSSSSRCWAGPRGGTGAGTRWTQRESSARPARTAAPLAQTFCWSRRSAARRSAGARPGSFAVDAASEGRRHPWRDLSCVWQVLVSNAACALPRSRLTCGASAPQSTSSLNQSRARRTGMNALMHESGSIASASHANISTRARQGESNRSMQACCSQKREKQQ